MGQKQDQPPTAPSGTSPPTESSSSRQTLTGAPGSDNDSRGDSATAPTLAAPPAAPSPAAPLDAATLAASDAPQSPTPPLLPPPLAPPAPESPLRPVSSTPPVVRIGAGEIDDGGFAARYRLRTLLGRGGMGEVLLYHDQRIGRDVAMKIIRRGRGSSGDARVRFLREVRVQGQLEHPAMVPVYDLGTSPDGEIYFTMKPIRGVSLDRILDRLRRGDPEAAQTYSRHRLLTVFSSICLAIDFAHQRGVIHRDLKPANLMLGDFGEVHVLDWGLARVSGADDAPPPPQAAEETDEGPLRTQAGQIMGTPGYMAPEQVRGDLAALSPRADVYALGAILFELLTQHYLHEGKSYEDLLVSTLRGADPRPSVRCPGAEVPPELEAICVQATAPAPEGRPPSARALHEAVERFLAGDRDVELRRELAQVHAQRAEETCARALHHQEVGGAAAEQERSAALQEVGRALALDPRNAAAARTFLRLLTQPPRDIPAEARAALAESTRQAGRRAHRAGGFAALALLPVLPLMLWMGVRSLALVLLMGLCAAALAVLGFLNARGQGDSARSALHVLVPPLCLCGCLLASRIAGPFMLVPALATLAAVSFAQQSDRRMRLLGVAACVAAIVLPTALEALGALPPSYLFHDGTLVIRAQMLALPAVPTQLFLLLGSIGVVLIAVTYTSYLRDGLERAEERFHVQHWQLGQILPKEARLAARSPAAEQEDSLRAFLHHRVKARRGREVG